MWKFGENHLIDTSLLSSIVESNLDQESHNLNTDINDGIIDKAVEVYKHVSAGIHSSVGHTVNVYPKNVVHIPQLILEQSLGGLVPNMLFIPEMRTFEYAEIDDHLSLRIKNKWLYSGDYSSFEDMNDWLFFYDGTNMELTSPSIPSTGETLKRYKYDSDNDKSIFYLSEFPVQNFITAEADSIIDPLLGIVIQDGQTDDFVVTSYDTTPLLSFLPEGVKIDLQKIESTTETGKLILLDTRVEV